ncbi:hypothetical protein N431DRAFT_477933 [Stipitochalara longipes BDJ]|nr:hypothetical protein N431DRAFT_477933 [Stipitochalara longipes BDJ]
MADSKSDQSPEFSFSDDGGRPYVREYQNTSKFRPGDQVYFRQDGSGAQEGPYYIASVPSAGRYTLALADGRKAKNGDEVAEKDLTEA